MKRHRNKRELNSDREKMAIGRTLPEFDRPPLNEVVFGVQFDPVTGLHAAHLGTFWQRIRDRYPNTEEHPPVAHQREKPDLTADAEFEFGALPLVPRCWFLDETKLQLVQIQRDRFLRNWRQIEGQEPYPRYSSLFAQFRSEWQLFLGFLGEEKIELPRINQCELTYINHIPQGDAWNTLGDLGKVFSVGEIRPTASFLPVPELAAWRMSYRLPNGNGRLHVQLKQGLRGRDKKPIFLLDLTARGAPSGNEDMQVASWFEMAHEWIVRGFTDLTTPAMHQQWGRTI